MGSEKTLTVLIGNARGGEKTWNSMYENLLKPYNSDLAICFGKTKNKNISLYKRANYIWEMEEYENWRDYYNEVCNGFWEKSLMIGVHNGVTGGIDNHEGSGSIIFAFRHFIKNNCKNILLEYDRIILTRSDFYYAYKHQILSNDYFWIPEGEDYGGKCDRHHIFPSNMIDNVLGIVEFLDSEEGYNKLLKLTHPYTNSEGFLETYFATSGVLKKIKRYPRVNFTVATKDDTTRWRVAKNELPEHSDLLLKYPSEYEDCMFNITNNKIVDII